MEPERVLKSCDDGYAWPCATVASAVRQTRVHATFHKPKLGTIYSGGCKYHLYQAHSPLARRAKPVPALPARPAADNDPELHPGLHGVPRRRLPPLPPRRLVRQPRALLWRWRRRVGRVGARAAQRRLRHERRPPQGGEQKRRQRPQRGRAINEVLAGQHALLRSLPLIDMPNLAINQSLDFFAL